MAVRTAYDPTAGEILTATNLEKLAGGWIGYAEAVASQTPITTIVDLTSLTVAVTVGPSRRIKVSASTYVSSTVNGDGVAIKIKEGATQLVERGTKLVANDEFNGLPAEVVLTPTTGAHTYKVTMERSSGTGNVTSNAAATFPAFILVEDLGPAA